MSMTTATFGGQRVLFAELPENGRGGCDYAFNHRQDGTAPEHYFRLQRPSACISRVNSAASGSDTSDSFYRCSYPPRQTPSCREGYSEARGYKITCDKSASASPTKGLLPSTLRYAW